MRVSLCLLMMFYSGLQLLHAQTVSVRFEVNMKVWIDRDDFDPDTDFVDVAGTFNSWGEPGDQLERIDSSTIYAVELGGFEAGQQILFKFRKNGLWSGEEEFAGGRPNRSYAVTQGENTISVFYNDEPDPTGPPKAQFSAISTTVFTNGLMSFQNTSSGRITEFQWFFEGGSPEQSTERSPAIRYPSTGTYDVQLIARNDSTADTLRIENYITVEDRTLESPKWWNERVFYEIFVRSFYDSDGDGIGDFNGMTEKLDYLNDGDPTTTTDLGITGIWLMPIHPSPSYHGYDVTDYREVNPQYGTMDEFKAFLDAAHERGIAVIIDFVMNHSSSQHPWFQQSASGNSFYRDFYRWSDTNPGYSGPWGQQVWHQRNSDYYYGLFWGGMPDINYDNEAVKDSIFSAATFWLEEVGVDGFRQDAVLYIDEDDGNLKNTQGTFDFWEEFNLHVKNINADAFNVGEAWEPTDIVLQYISNDRLDYAFEFDLAGSILNAVNSGTASSLISQMQKVYDAYPFLQYGTFLTNHDQNRVMNVLGQDINKAKLAASLYLTLPGIPYLYYGEEVGMLGQKPDENIRLPMQWSAASNAGFTTGSPWRTPNSNFRDFNVAQQDTTEGSLFN
ncbi:MAG: alpha-amylase family glycosyl hydrolase, partial [Bacteroidota bacterium]